MFNYQFVEIHSRLLQGSFYLILWRSCCSICFLCNVLQIIVCPFILFLLAIALSVTSSTYDFGPPPLWYLQTFPVTVLKYNQLSTSGAGTAYPSGTPEFTSSFQWGSGYSIFSFIFMCCRSFFVLFYFFFWPLCFLFFFDIGILIAPLVSSNSSSFC